MGRAYLALEDTQSTNKSYLKSIRTYTGQMASSLSVGGDYVMTAAYRISVTSPSSTLISLAGIAGFPTDLVRVLIIKEADENDYIHFEIGGVASTSTPQWPSGGLSIPLTATVADTIQVIRSGAADVHATLIVMTPR